ncbi:MAG: porin [Planctomycetota bacterium]
MKSITLPLAASVLLSSFAASASNDPRADDPPGETSPLPATYKTLVENETVTVQWGGRIWYDTAWVTGDRRSFETDDGSEIRNGRVYARGTLFDTVDFKAEWDFAGGEPVAKDLLLEIPTPFGAIEVGHFKEPMSLERLTSGNYRTFVEPSLADTFVPSRNLGIMYADGTESAGLNWAVGFFRETDDSGEGTGDGESALTGRLAGHAWYEEDGASVLHWGVSASTRGDDGGVEEFASAPETHLANKVATSGEILSDGTDLAGLEAAWVRGPLSVQGEYTMAAVSATGGDEDADFSAYYLQGSYFLTGEHRPYKAKGATFDRVRPLENYTGDAGGGAFEVAARVSSLDLDDGPSTDELHDITLGLNWYLNPHARVMLDYIRANFEAGDVDDDADIFVVRFHVDW